MNGGSDMLEQVLCYLQNWFIVPGGVHRGTFRIEGGNASLLFLRDGQYFRIQGSVFNDGLHQYPAADLTDEEFTGAVWALAVPKAVISLSEEISTWNKKYADVCMSPYSSESKADYSYSKAIDAEGSGTITWQSAFRSRLAPYRKIREYGVITNGGKNCEPN